jgi:hypothetical protein
MIVKLKRFAYSDTETEGKLIVGSTTLATIERPWIENPNGALGGKPKESCIPDGMYRLSPHVRLSGEECWIIHNPELGVYRLPQDHEEGKGRDLILIHRGNWVTDFIGCIGPGMRRKPSVNPKIGNIEQAVADSGGAMLELRRLLGYGQHILSITNETGASNGNR